MGNLGRVQHLQMCLNTNPALKEVIEGLSVMYSLESKSLQSVCKYIITMSFYNFSSYNWKIQYPLLFEIMLKHVKYLENQANIKLHTNCKQSSNEFSVTE